MRIQLNITSEIARKFCGESNISHKSICTIEQDEQNFSTPLNFQDFHKHMEKVKKIATEIWLKQILRKSFFHLPQRNQMCLHKNNSNNANSDDNDDVDDGADGNDNNNDYRDDDAMIVMMVVVVVMMMIVMMMMLKIIMIVVMMMMIVMMLKIMLMMMMMVMMMIVIAT